MVLILITDVAAIETRESARFYKRPEFFTKKLSNAQKISEWCKKMSKSLWYGEQRYVVHTVQVEESLLQVPWLDIWAALREKVPNVLSRHTKSRAGARGRARPSFGMTTTQDIRYLFV